MSAREGRGAYGKAEPTEGDGGVRVEHKHDLVPRAEKVERRVRRHERAYRRVREQHAQPEGLVGHLVVGLLGDGCGGARAVFRRALYGRALFGCADFAGQGLRACEKHNTD